jgi:hypothetical protein
MSPQKKRLPDTDINEVAIKFLRDHPEAKQALEIFGIANDRYQQYLAAQLAPKFYTAISTVEGEQNGELG